MKQQSHELRTAFKQASSMPSPSWDSKDTNSKELKGIVDVDVGKLFKTPAPVPEFVFDGLIPRGILVGIQGEGGIGKSFAVQELIISAAIGRALLPSFQPTKPMKILWLQGEDTEDEIHRRCQKIMNRFALKPSELELCENNIVLRLMTASPLVESPHGVQRTTQTYDCLVETIKEHEPDIIVLDPQSSFFSGDENDNIVMAQFMGKLKELTSLTPRPSTLISVHHVSKTRQGAMDSGSGRGASAGRDAQRSVFTLIKLTVDEAEKYGISGNANEYVVMGQTKSNMTLLMDGNMILKRDTDDKTGGVFTEVPANGMRNRARVKKTKAIAQAITEVVGLNPENYTIDEWTKSKREAREKLTREVKVKVNVKVSRQDMLDGFDSALEQGLLIIERVPVPNSKRPKNVPRVPRNE